MKFRWSSKSKNKPPKNYIGLDPKFVAHLNRRTAAGSNPNPNQKYFTLQPSLSNNELHVKRTISTLQQILKNGNEDLRPFDTRTESTVRETKNRLINLQAEAKQYQTTESNT